MAPARNYTNITGLKVGQDRSRTQLSIDALSQKKGADQLLGVILAFNSPMQFSGIGGFENVSLANVSSQGENFRVVHEPVGDRYGYRVEIALFSASAKGHHVAFVWRRSLIMWEKRSESCWPRKDNSARKGAFGDSYTWEFAAQKTTKTCLCVQASG